MLAGYTVIKLLRATARTRVYEAERKRDAKRVIAKVFDVDDPAVEAQVEHEFRLLEGLDIPGVVRPLGIERSGRQLALLLDYVPGRTLEQLAGGEALPLDRFVPIACEMATKLARIHERRIVHRDIKPSNVLVGHEGGEIVFADFGISVVLEDERRALYDPDVLHGTLPYVSPEQTGRTRREVDFRSDLYSLGVTFYELLTGRRPFEAKVPLELIHAHLAQRPTPPRELDARIPTVLSAIVMKLLEKPPEHRYQSARGLHADLVRFASARERGEVEPEFALAEHDFAATLQMPHQLYGRERERAGLAAELAEVVERGRPGLLVVSGHSGAGKSSLLRTIDAPLATRGGYLGIGAFEARALPYAGVAQALAGVVGQLLIESDEQLGAWRRRLRARLGGLTGTALALVPTLALVLDEPASEGDTELEPAEARNRLHLALSRLVATLGERAPLVLILDDLQWADAGSLELLLALLTDPTLGRVLILGGYRSDEVDAQHGLAVLLDQLETRGVALRRMPLEPLRDDAIEQLLVDVLGRPREEVAALAEIIERKTENNPFFVRAYLGQLADLGLLQASERGWQWQLDAIRHAAVPDDLLGVMQAKLERLPARERELLERAACIGSRFEIAVLEAIAELPSEALAASLHALESAGLLSQIGSEITFCHDQIREGARVDEARRRGLHRRIARELLARADERPRGQLLFEIVGQFERSLVHPSELDERERETLTSLALAAGEQALHSAAWESARRYLELAKRLCGERRDAVAFGAHFGHAQALALTDANEDADRAFASLLEWPLSPVERGRVAARQIHILRMQDRTRDAVASGLAALARLGVALPAKPSLVQMLVQVMLAWRKLRGRTLADLEALTEARGEQAEARDEQALAATYVINAMKWPAFSAEPQLYVYLVALHCRLIIKHGHHRSAAEAIAQLAFIGLALGQPAEAYQMCAVAIELAEKRETSPFSQLAAQALMAMYVGPTARPFPLWREPMAAAFERALEIGDRLHAGYLAAVHVQVQLETGTHLREVVALEASFRRRNPGHGTIEPRTIAEFVVRFAATLGAETLADSPGFLDPASLPSPDHASDPSQAISQVTRVAATSIEMLGRLLLEQHERAWALAETIAASYEQATVGIWIAPRISLLDALICGTRARARPSERRALRRRIAKRRAHLRKFASVCPENYAASVAMVEAELAWLDGKPREAFDSLERARAEASESSRTYVEILACLRLAELAGAQGWTSAEAGALRGAHAALTRWGAWAALRELERRHPILVGSSLSTADPTLRLDPRSETYRRLNTSSSVSSLDLESVLSTMQLIGEDLRLEEVISRVLAGAIENAGADRGALLLHRAGAFALVAEGRLADPSEGPDSGPRSAYLDPPLDLRDAGSRVPTSVVQYVLRTGEPIVLDDVRADARFAGDPYVAASGVRALLCMPIVKHQARVGALLLENRATRSFSEHRLETLRILLGQAGSALDNARLYAQLERSEAQWRSLVDGVPDIIALMDRQGHVEFVNHLDQPHQPSHMDASSAAAWREAFASVVETGEQRELEICVAPPGLPRRHFMTRIAPVRIRLESGQLKAERLLAISTDITARKGLEAQLRQQQRLESVGTLASGVAHEINNPIQGILNYAELIRARIDERGTVLEMVGEIEHESTRVATIVRTLLSFARKDDGEMVDAELRSIVDGTLSLIHVVLRKDQIGVSIDIPDGLLPVRCRPPQIQQIVMNLVTNARDALNQRYGEVDERKQIEIAAAAFERDDRRWVRLSVADRGAGIPEEVRARIFDPFFTTKGREQGTGLGLSLSHKIASDHGGELWVESEVEVGTRFYLDLPAAD